MTSIEMLREFKVGMDKIDSSSYPEIYDEQIFMYINKAIDEVVNEGRRVFEKDQVITDNLKSLIPDKPKRILPSSNTDTEYLFSLSGHDYVFYIRSYFITQVGDIKGRASAVVTQQDDLDVILDDPYNSPRPYSVPITFARNSITAHATANFKINELYLVYVKKPVIVAKNKNCDLDTQLHYTIVDRAVQLAEISLGMLNKRED